MKYLFSFLLLLFAFSLQPLQTAVFAQAPTSIEDALLSGVSIDFESAAIIGIGRIAQMVRNEAPIQTLGVLTQTQRAQPQRQSGANNRMGLRLFNLMSDSLLSESASLIDIDPTLAVSTEIIDADVDIDAVSVESGRMYPPRLSVDFQKFPIPTYAIMPDVEQQKRMEKLNSQLQKRFGEAVKADYLDNVHYLRGTVDSERQKEVLEIFVKMEPGLQ